MGDAQSIKKSDQLSQACEKGVDGHCDDDGGKRPGPILTLEDLLPQHSHLGWGFSDLAFYSAHVSHFLIFGFCILPCSRSCARSLLQVPFCTESSHRDQHCFCFDEPLSQQTHASTLKTRLESLILSSPSFF